MDGLFALFFLFVAAEVVIAWVHPVWEAVKWCASKLRRPLLICAIMSATGVAPVFADAGNSAPPPPPDPKHFLFEIDWGPRPRLWVGWGNGDDSWMCGFGAEPDRE